jgi:hypothetical protein
VEILQVAAGDGRLSATELDERLDVGDLVIPQL